nr:unnamed protein product [Spirometra erinaceieuropaei]
MGDPNFAHVVIDGSVLEGGGQILRNAVSLSVLAKKAVTIEKIRAGRPKPGLSPQHLTGLELAALVSDAQLQGCISGSQQITFKPKCIKTGEFEGDTKTAGSVALLAQITVPILAFGQHASTLILKGGTDASFAPPIDYLSEVTAHYYRKMGLHFDIEVLERISKVFGSAFVAGKVPIKVAEEMSAVARRLFRNHLPECPINISAFRAPDNRFHGSVATFLFVLETSTGCRLAASRLSQPRGPSAEDLVTDAIEELMNSVRAGSCCDENMQDMLVLPMALADGKSSLRTTALTLHTQSAIYVAEKLLPVKFVVEEQANGTVLLSCEGVGLSGSSL